LKQPKKGELFNAETKKAGGETSDKIKKYSDSKAE
jgi:hypothetical protein